MADDQVKKTDDAEKKQTAILHKKKTDVGDEKVAPASETIDKKKVVVVKKKVQTVSADSTPNATVKKVHAVTKSQHDTRGQADKPKTSRPVTSFELNPQRPNSKVGNLAERGRPQQRGAPHGRREGGFTGAQAREGYQRNNNYQGGGQGRPDGSQGRPGGYQGGGYQGRPGGYQGGGQGRPDGSQGRQGGAPGRQGGAPGRQGGGYQGRPGGYQGGGQGRPGGYGAPASLPVADAKKTPAKKTFKAKKVVYRKDRENTEIVDKLMSQKKKTVVMANPVPKSIEIMESVSVSELAKKMNLKASEIIAKLMGMGMMATINQNIDADTAILVASEYECDVKIISLYDETVIESQVDVEEDMASRPPVVTIMGHVDHGKTKTLDAIRSADVVSGEFGGITQHIGAYMVHTPKGAITFLDTPGHEAFSMMRARGAKVTDIVILVVAADDGVMPQTVEAINHAKDAKVPIIVAINKIDKPESNPDRVKTELSAHDLTPEEWGGTTQFVHISALKKEGLDDLLDAILLQSEMLELKANWNCRAEGKVIESRVDHGRGIVSTIIVERGTLRQGEPYVAGIFSGRVRAIFSDHGEKLDVATPSMPVEILGFEGMPNAGDPFQVTVNEREARDISSKRQELKRFEHSKTVKKVTLDNLYDTIFDGSLLELKVVIKADVQGSAEALKQSLEKLSTPEIRLSVIHSSAGAINESDVTLASADSNAIIIGFNVRPTPKAKLLATQEGVEIRNYNIIYKAVEEIQQAMEGMLKPDLKEEVIGTIEVRDTFKVPKIGLIAGCYVLQGIVKRTSSVNIIRDGIVIHTGKIASLRRFKDEAKEVATGFECGIGIENWQDVQVNDQFEVFEMVEVARKLSDTKATKEVPETEAKDGE